MKEKYLVSILVPIFNVEKYLEECLNSIINQTLKNIEIICINDGSTDSSLEIIQSFMIKDSRIKLIDKQNSGYGDSMNQGLKIATGEYIGIVESDDIADLKMFESLYKSAEQNNFPDIIKSNYYEYWSKDSGKRIKYNLPNNLYEKVFTPTKEKKIFNSLPSIWSAIYKKEFILINKIFFNPTPGASYQDTGFNFKTLALAKTMICKKEAYLIYRRDNEVSSVNQKNKVFCICDEFLSIEKFLKQKVSLFKVLKPIENYIKFNTYIRNYKRISDSYKKEFILHIKEIFEKELKNKYLEKTIFDEQHWQLLQSLLIGYDEFIQVYETLYNKYLIDNIKKIEKQLYNTIREETPIVLYGFNDIAQKLFYTISKSYSNIEIIDRNKAGNKFNEIIIKPIEVCNLTKEKVVIICTQNKIFIEEIKKTIFNINKNIKIISL